MAPKFSRSKPGCSVCLDTPFVLKVISPCSHTCCEACLTKSIQNVQPGESFPCPLCQAECTLPSGGLPDLEDYGEPSEATTFIACRSCRFAKSADIEAENVCLDCGNVNLCRDCSTIHAKSMATADHNLISIKKQRGSCETHGELLNSFCSSCSVWCCCL